MNKAEKACEELRAMDELAAMDSPVHGMDPLPKLLLTVFYIFVTVSFNKYDITGLFFMILFPVVAYQIAGLPYTLAFTSSVLLCRLCVLLDYSIRFLTRKSWRISGA